MTKHAYPLLHTINHPEDLRKVPRTQLKTLADELRAYLLHSVARTGGHLSSNLGTVELTVALHYVFSTPQDRLVWDVGHQTYPHKILTGRRDRMETLRQFGGLSGFPQRSESERDDCNGGGTNSEFSFCHDKIISSNFIQSVLHADSDGRFFLSFRDFSSIPKTSSTIPAPFLGKSVFFSPLVVIFKTVSVQEKYNGHFLTFSSFQRFFHLQGSLICLHI